MHHLIMEMDKLFPISNELEITFDSEEPSYDKAWFKYVTSIIDGLSRWCKDMKITRYNFGYSQIAITFTFAETKDAMAFKLRWLVGNGSCGF